MKVQLLSLIALLCISTQLFAQERKILRNKQMSATTIDEKQLEFLMSQKEELDKFEQPTSMGMIEVPVKIHIVRGSKDKAPLGIKEIREAFGSLNKHFINIYMQFVPLGDFNYISNDEYFTLEKDKEQALCGPHDVENVINLYIVGDIQEGPMSFCGYTYYPQSFPKQSKSKNVDRVIMAKDCFTDKVSLARQMGHYFTLFSTTGLQQSETNEWVNGENCTTEGDMICDTPADPGLTLSTVDDRCGYTGRRQDKSGRRRFYKPDTHNLMSDNPRLYCCTHFTEQQYRKMMFAAIKLRNYLNFPKSQYSKKQLKTLALEKGIQGEVAMYVHSDVLATERNNNMYINSDQALYPRTPYSIKVTTHKKGYVYVLEGDKERGIYLQYPKKGDKVYFKGEEKVEFLVPSNNDKLKIDELKGPDGKNHIVVLFSKKQLQIEELVDQMNSIDEYIDVVQRVYSVIGTNIIPSKNLTYSKTGIQVSGVATDQQIMPIIIEYLQN